MGGFFCCKEVRLAYNKVCTIDTILLAAACSRTGELFDDGQHIIYVNGENTDTSTALGQLMVDMQQADAAKISNKVLANKMNTLKKGRAFEKMCQEIEKLTAEITAEEQVNGIKKLAKVCREFGAEQNAIAQKLMEQYAISEDEAKAYATEACKN